MKPPTPALIPSTLVPILVLASVSGCASTAPARLTVAEEIAAAAGLSEPIRFETRGQPADVAAPAGQALTLEDAVRRTLAHSPELQAALARVRAAQADAKQARLFPNPILSVVFRWPEGGGSPTVEAGLAADLISLLRRPGQVSAAESRLRAAAAEAVSQALEVLAEVRGRYVAVQTSDELLGVLRERLRIIDRLLGVARDRLQAGEATRLDVVGLEAQRIELLTEIAEQELDRREQRLALSRLIGEPSGRAEWSIAPWGPDRHFALSEERWVALSLEHRPEVQARRFELEALAADLGLTRLAPFDGAELGVEGEREEGDWGVGPGVSTPLPIFDWGQARRQRARAALVEARHNLTRVRRQVIEETRLAYATLAATDANLHRVRDELVPLAERRHELAEQQFKAGELDVTGLLQAEEELRAARTRLVELERRTTEALIRLQRAVGGPGIVASVTAGDVPTTTAPSTQAATPPAPRPTTGGGQTDEPNRED